MESFFKFSERGTNFQTELLAGVTTFLTMAYIVFVNPGILSAAASRSKARRRPPRSARRSCASPWDSSATARWRLPRAWA